MTNPFQTHKYVGKRAKYVAKKVNHPNAEAVIVKVAQAKERAIKTKNTLNLSNGLNVKYVKPKFAPLSVEVDTVNNVQPKDWDTNPEDKNSQKYSQEKEILTTSMEKPNKVSLIEKTSGIRGADLFFISTITDAYYLEERMTFNVITLFLSPYCLLCASIYTTGSFLIVFIT